MKPESFARYLNIFIKMHVAQSVTRLINVFAKNEKGNDTDDQWEK